MNHSYNARNIQGMNHNRNYDQSMFADASPRINHRRPSFEELNTFLGDGGTNNASRTKVQPVGKDSIGGKISFQVTKGKTSVDKEGAQGPSKKVLFTSKPIVPMKEPRDPNFVFDQLETLVNSEQQDIDTTAPERNGHRRDAMTRQDSASAMSIECHASLILEELAKDINGVAANKDGDYDDSDDADNKSITLEDLTLNARSPSAESAGFDAHAFVQTSPKRQLEHEEDLIHEIVAIEGLLLDGPSSNAISVESHDSVIFEELAKEIEEGADGDDDDKSITLEDLMHRSVMLPQRHRRKRRRRRRDATRRDAAAHDSEANLSDRHLSPSAISFEGHDSLILEHIANELDEGDNNDDCDRSITLEDLREDFTRTRLSAVAKFEESVINRNVSSGNLFHDGFHLSFRR